MLQNCSIRINPYLVDEKRPDNPICWLLDSLASHVQHVPEKISTYYIFMHFWDLLKGQGKIFCLCICTRRTFVSYKSLQHVKTTQFVLIPSRNKLMLITILMRCNFSGTYLLGIKCKLITTLLPGNKVWQLQIYTPTKWRALNMEQIACVLLDFGVRYNYSIIIQVHQSGRHTWLYAIIVF